MTKTRKRQVEKLEEDPELKAIGVQKILDAAVNEYGLTYSEDGSGGLTAFQRVFINGVKWATSLKVNEIVDQSFRIKQLLIENGTIESRFKAHERMIKLFSSMWISWFKDNKGENFVSVEVNHDEFGPYEITMRRKLGKSPEQVASEAKDQVEAQEVVIAALKKRLADAGLPIDV